MESEAQKSLKVFCTQLLEFMDDILQYFLII